MLDTYRGVFGALPYAVLNTDSWTMRVYGVVGTLAALLVTVVVGLALVVWMGETADMEGGLFFFTRSMYVILGLAAVGPLIAPMLFVARRHRRGDPVAPNYDRALATTGFVFLASLYLAMLISAPADLRDPTDVAVVNALYALPPLVGLVPPVVAGLLVFWTHRRLRRPAGEDGTGADEGERADVTAEPNDGRGTDDGDATDDEKPT